MKKLSWSLLVTVLFLSCKKEAAIYTEPIPEYATYRLMLTTTWSAPALKVPVNAHFTTLVGMVHATDTFLWGNMPATVGLENVAETGNPTKMNAELDAIILRQKALAQFAIAPPAVNTTIEFPLTFTTKYPALSFASMIAPSPDWFMGINNYNLIQNNKWVEDVTIDLFVYDAGSEDGDVFGYNSPATVPLQNVHLLTPTTGMVLANGNPVIARIATLRFIKN